MGIGRYLREREYPNPPPPSTNNTSRTINRVSTFHLFSISAMHVGNQAECMRTQSTPPKVPQVVMCKPRPLRQQCCWSDHQPSSKRAGYRPRHLRLVTAHGQVTLCGHSSIFKSARQFPDRLYPRRCSSQAHGDFWQIRRGKNDAHAQHDRGRPSRRLSGWSRWRGGQELIQLVSFSE